MILGLDNAYFYWIPNGVGLFPIATFLYAVFVKKTKDRNFYALYFLGLFFLFAMTRRFPWDLLQNIFGIIQFPWRLMIYATLFFALSAAALAAAPVFLLSCYLAELKSFSAGSSTARS